LKPRKTAQARRRRGWGSAVKTVYDGVLYASKAEARYAEHLDWLMSRGEIAGWEAQVRWPLVVNGVKVCVMVPDFRVWFDKKRYELRECKGWPQPMWRLKLKLFRALHPDVPYVIVPAEEARNARVH
jgi:hypothetical protein